MPPQLHLTLPPPNPSATPAARLLAPPLPGDPAARDIEYLEVFCNPNAHATAFDARALITLRTADGLRVTTEGKLTGVKADVEEFLAAPQ